MSVSESHRVFFFVFFFSQSAPFRHGRSEDSDVTCDEGGKQIAELLILGSRWGEQDAFVFAF